MLIFLRGRKGSVRTCEKLGETGRTGRKLDRKGGNRRVNRKFTAGEAKNSGQ